jgi:hypothetical protein
VGSYLGAAAATLAATGISYTQRALSTPARLIRRRVDRIDGALTLLDGSLVILDRPTLLAPLERALRAMSWSIPLLAAALLLSHLARG